MSRDRRALEAPLNLEQNPKRVPHLPRWARASKLATPHAILRIGINLSWLVKLRWGAVVGQLVTIAFVDRAMGIPLPMTPLLGLVGLEAASNAAAALWLRERRRCRAGCCRR